MALEHNPLSKMELKHWPDVLLAVSGPFFLMVIASVLLGSLTGIILAPGAFGLFLFALAGRIAHYKYPVEIPKAPRKEFVSGWRHSFLADTFAVIGIILMLISAMLISVEAWSLFQHGEHCLLTEKS